MDTLLIISLVLLGLVLLVGAIVMFFGLRKAQHGFEDEEGFHNDGRRNRRPKR